MTLEPAHPQRLRPGAVPMSTAERPEPTWDGATLGVRDAANVWRQVMGRRVAAGRTTTRGDAE